jgi:uncharacterized protein (TIGR02996 family)
VAGVLDQLMRRIDEAPDDLSLYLVLSDHFQESGDPRGELIAVQCALAQATDAKERERLEQKQAAFFKAHHLALMGAKDEVALAGAKWSNGYVRSAGTPPASLLAAFLRHPSTRFLQELTIQNPYLPTGEMVDRIAETRHPSLRRLTFNSTQGKQVGLDPVDITRVVSWLPRLRELLVCAHAISLRPADSQLDRLELVSEGPTASLLEVISEAKWPRLKELWIDHSRPRYRQLWRRSGGRPPHLEEGGGFVPRKFFLGKATPALEFLALRSIDLDVAFYQALCAAPLLRQLRRLDLSHARLDDETMRPLVANQHAFRHLERLDLLGATVSEGTSEQLAQLCPDVRL